MPTTSWNAIAYPNNSDTESWAAQYANLSNKVGTQGVPVFATTAARDAALPARAVGQICYVTATQLYYMWGLGPSAVGAAGTASWRPIRPSTTLYSVTPELRTNSTALVNSALTVPLKANRIYYFEITASVSGDPTNDWRYALTIPAGAGGRHFARTSANNMTLRTTMQMQSYAPVTWATSRFTGLSTDGLGVPVKIWGTVTVGGTAGNLTLQHGQVVAGAISSSLDFWVVTCTEVG